MKDADVILYVTDATEGTDHRSEYVDKIRLSGIKTILVINKIDLTTPEELEKLVDEWEKILPDAVIVPVSAAHAFNIEGCLIGFSICCLRVNPIIPKMP